MGKANQDRPRPKLKIKKNDVVEVIAGKDRGKRGKVLQVLPERGRIIVERVNMIKRHTRPSKLTGRGGIIEKEASLQISNVMLVCPKTLQPTRVGRTRLSDGRLVRVAKVSGEVID